MRWFGLDECLRLVHANPTQQADGAAAKPGRWTGSGSGAAGREPAFLHCIIPEELDLVAAAYRRERGGTDAAAGGPKAP